MKSHLRPVSAILSIVVALLVGLGVGGGPLDAADNTANRFDSNDRKEIGEIIKSYLIEHPEMMLEMQDALVKKEKENQAEKVRSAVAEILSGSNNSIGGSADGDVTIIEFFDYNCDPCRKARSHVEKLVDADKKLRFVFMEHPIFSRGSVEASQVALAAKRQQKYWEFYQAMLAHKGTADRESALKVAESLDLDMEKLKTDMESDEVTDELVRSKRLAEKIGIIGTPHFIVGGQSFIGSSDLHDRITATAAALRKNSP